MRSIDLAAVRPDMTAFPSYVSLSESLNYVLEANEKDFTTLIENIGIKELAVFESTGSVVLYEEGDENDDEVKEEKFNFIEKAWARVKAFFEKILNQIKATITNILNKKINRKKEDLAKAVAKMNDGYEVKTYTYSGVKAKITGSEKEVDTYKKLDTRSFGYSFDKDTTTKYKEKMRGSELSITKKNIGGMLDEIIQYSTDFKANQNKLSAIYKAAKENYEAVIKQYKSNKGDNKEQLSNMRTAVQLATTHCNIALSTYYEMFGTYTKVIVDLNKILKKETSEKKDDKAKVNESAFDTELSSLFDWNY